MAPIDRTHRAVIFAIAQLSCYVFVPSYILIANMHAARKEFFSVMYSVGIAEVALFLTFKHSDSRSAGPNRWLTYKLTPMIERLEVGTEESDRSLF